MPEKTGRQKRAEFDYNASPHLRRIIQSLIHAVLPEEGSDRGRHAIKVLAARDFFLYGIAMVGHRDVVGQRQNLDPFLWRIGEDGKAVMSEGHHKHAEGLGVHMTLKRHEFLVLALDGEMPPMDLQEDGTLKDPQPWIDAWRRVEVQLDRFLNR